MIHTSNFQNTALSEFLMLRELSRFSKQHYRNPSGAAGEIYQIHASQE
jgi:hypothetical protein